MLALLLVFVILPIVELAVMVQVAGAIGVLPTILAVVLVSLAGAWLMKVEGLGVLRRARTQVADGQVPAVEVVDGLMILAGGTLMFVPGFVTGAFGLLLLVPPIRALLRPVVLARFRRRIERGDATFMVFSSGQSFRGPGRGPVMGGPVYEAEGHLQERPTSPGDHGSSPRPELGP